VSATTDAREATASGAGARSAAPAADGELEAAVRDLPEGEETRSYLARRAELGLAASPAAPAIVSADGAPVAPAAVARHLRVARTVRVSVEGNAGLCRGLLKTRYGIHDPEEDPR
jgi:hypothetical protein